MPWIDSWTDLANELAGQRVGLTINQIVERSGKSRKTVLRWLEKIEIEYPQVEIVKQREYGGGPYRISLKGYRRHGARPNLPHRFTADELATLDSAIAFLRDQNMAPKFHRLERIREKLLDLLSDRELKEFELYSGPVRKAAAWAPRPHPQLRIDETVERPIAEAITQMSVVKFDYCSQEDLSKCTIAPAGFLYSTRPYLVGWPSWDVSGEPRKFRLEKIRNVRTTDKTFTFPEDFDLKEYAEEAIGPFHGPKFDVVLRFAPHASPDAMLWVFNKRQQIDLKKDGSTIVRFRTSGDVALCHHLFTWGDAVEILEPSELRATYVNLLQAAMDAQNPIQERHLS